MKIGLNFDTFTSLFDEAVKAGYDYAECPFCIFAEKSDEEIAEMKKKSDESGMPILAANCLFWGEVKLLGEGATPRATLIEYLKRGFTKAEQLGVKKVVCGSGRGRSLPEGYDTEKGLDELAEIFRMTADIAAKHGCLIVIEPLNDKETNICTSVKEGAAFVARIDHPHVKLLADSYHMRAVRESFDALGDYKDILMHMHIAEGIEGETSLRACPNRKDENNIKSFVDALKAIGYDDTLTVEANKPEDQVVVLINEAIEVLRDWTK